MTQATPGPPAAASTARRRILFVTWQYYPIPAGGAEHQAQLQAEELARRGHEVTVATRRTAGAGSGPVRGVRVTRLPSVDRRPLRTATFLLSLALYLLLNGRRFDLVHVHLAGVYTDAVVWLASRLGVPVYLKIAAGGESGEVRKLRRIARFTRFYGLRHATRVQALSREIAEELRDAGVRADRIVRVPNGVDAAMASDGASERASRRRDLGIPEAGTIVLYLGRFSRYKGVSDLVEAWSSLPAGAREGAYLLLVGFRADRPPEEQLALTPDSETVLVHPWTVRARDYLRAADVFVLPSHSEGMSNALLEAMAEGLPVVATRVGAAEDMIEDGETGILVPPVQPDRLAAALARVLGNEEERRRLGHAAAAAIERNYSIAAVVSRLEEAYAAMLAERRPRPG